MVNTVAQRVQVLLLCLLIPAGILYAAVHFDTKAIRDFFVPSAAIMTINKVSFEVEVANTDEERTRGLSGRNDIGSQGLLFVFPEEGYYTFWMKDMNFPIDIIWINDAYRIVGIEKNVPPNSYPRVYRPEEPVKYVLETRIHFADTHSFKVGDTVTLPLERLED